MNIRRGTIGRILALALATTGWVSAQDTHPLSDQEGRTTPLNSTDKQSYDNTPLYRMQVVARDIPAINYMHKKDSTEIGFQGTDLLPDAKGKADVHAESGRTVIRADFDRLKPANSFGPEYLTYVLWAITPEGRPMNLGEVLPNGDKGRNHIEVTTDLQAFGLILTAEPYFAVTVPSDLVVAQNVVKEDKTNGIIQPITAHYSLLPRGAYEQTAGRKEVLHPITTDERHPLEVYEADNAIAIAEAAGADQYAADSMKAARLAQRNAQDADLKKSNRKEAITYAREAVQAAEDARLITIRKLHAADEEQARKGREEAEQRARMAQQAAQEQQRQRDEAERTAAQQAEAARMAQQQAEAAQREQQQAREAADQARQEQQRAQQQAESARQAQQQAEQSAQQMAQQAEQARERLREQLSQVLQTRETARGLIMDLSDVLFGFNKYELKPDARVKLAKISGILLAYPDLKVQVEGHTDNVGSPEYNQKLSEERADNVKNFLVSQSVPASNVTAQGFGENDPVADNTSNTGRAQNRRVELVVSGAAIGVDTGSSGAVSGARQGNPTGISNPAPGTPVGVGTPGTDTSGPR